MASLFHETVSAGLTPRQSAPACSIRSVLVCATIAAAVGGFAAGTSVSDAAPVQGGAELATLIRFMAAVKSVMALGGAGLVYWRLRHPARAFMTASYIASAVLMAAAPGLIWNMTGIVAGAVLFHAGLVLFLVAAWADGFPAGALLGAIARLKS